MLKSAAFPIFPCLVNASGLPCTWDANGNLLSDGVYNYSYNGANRLVSANNGTSTSFSYNGRGDRTCQVAGKLSGDAKGDSDVEF